MKKRSIKIACAAILLILIGVWDSARTPASIGKAETVEESMRALSGAILAAYERRDTAELKSFYAKQSGALFFWERKMQYSWDQINDTMDDLVRFVARMKLTTGEFRAGGSGDTGWFAATFHADRVTPEGKQFSSDGRWTVVAQRINGRWLIVHEHTSFPLAER
jgi:ketosteroid isomerase-like protein